MSLQNQLARMMDGLCTGKWDLLKETSEKCRQALGDLPQTRMRRW